MYPVMDFLSSAEMLMLFGVASGVLSTIAFIPYIRDTLSRKTEPQRASWLIWSVLGSIAFGSQVFEGATSSLWFAGVQVSGTIIVFLLSIRIGAGRFLSKSDHLILFAASIGLLLWYLTDNAAYALAITISISLLGGLATVVKAYRDPESETLITWVVSFVASVCAILSVGTLDLTLLAYPLYLFILYLAFIVAIVLGRARDKYADHTSVPSTRSFSFPLLFSGLRTAADVVIVAAAFVFAFAWVGANSSAVDVVSTDDSVIGSDMALADIRVERSNQMEAGVESVAVFSVAAKTPQQPDNNKQSGVLTGELPGYATRVVVVAVDRSSGLATDIEPLTTILKSLGVLPDAIISQDTAATAFIATPEGQPAIKPITETVATAVVPPPVTYVSPELSSPDIDHADGTSWIAGDFLLLDADDPFAQLVVTSDMAMLRSDIDSILPQNQLQQGERVLALATNGEWYRVQLSGGLQGYVHHTQVAVEALSSLHSRNPG